MGSSARILHKTWNLNVDQTWKKTMPMPHQPEYDDD